MSIFSDVYFSFETVMQITVLCRSMHEACCMQIQNEVCSFLKTTNTNIYNLSLGKCKMVMFISEYSVHRDALSGVFTLE